MNCWRLEKRLIWTPTANNKLLQKVLLNKDGFISHFDNAKSCASLALKVLG